MERLIVEVNESQTAFTVLSMSSRYDDDDDLIVGTVRRRSITSPRMRALDAGKASLIQCDTCVCTIIATVTTTTLMHFLQHDAATWPFCYCQVFTKTNSIKTRVLHFCNMQAVWQEWEVNKLRWRNMVIQCNRRLRNIWSLCTQCW
jgi:hypothetical protein